jgi:hypothetical protein
VNLIDYCGPQRKRRRRRRRRHMQPRACQYGGSVVQMEVKEKNEWVEGR